MVRRTSILWALIASGAGSAGAAAAPLTLDPGKPVMLTCQTQAIVIKDNGPAPSKGNVALRLERAASGNDATWTPATTDEAHKGAFAAVNTATCAAGCPMSIPATGEFQLWAPAPKSLDKLGADETLVLAVIKPDSQKPDSLTLKASTFRGQSIEALENGTCTVRP